MDETIFKERLDKIVEYCNNTTKESSYLEIAKALNMAPDVVEITIKSYVNTIQGHLEKNPLLAMEGPDPTLEILVYKIKELSPARFYIDGLKKYQRMVTAPGRLKTKIGGLFHKEG